MLYDIKKEFPLLQQNHLHYLDNAAMTQTPQCVIESSAKFDSILRSNVRRGMYRLAEEATLAYENARKNVANFLNVKNEKEIVFTSGSTASINIIAHAICNILSPGDEIVLTELEHHSNLVPWLLASKGKELKIKFIPITDDGRLDLSNLEELITNKCRAISITHGSNVTGAITEVEPIAKAARSVGAYLFLDGAQFAPHQKVDLEKLDVDFYTFSGHKIYGPTGIGVLWGKIELLQKLNPLMGGGGMTNEISGTEVIFCPPPYKFEAGTPPISQAIALSEAITWLDQLDRKNIENYLCKLTKDLYNKLSGFKGLKLISPNPETYQTLPIVSFHINNIHPHDICHILSTENVAVRGGHHCAQPLMNSLNIPAVTRASLAAYNNQEDIDALLLGIEKTLLKFL